ncbi:AAA family ATPase [Paenibacillus amylolyticus]|uniref:AAA family ATPase n=1 Tax=Paenibacillus amylolyticus TaxID=1451 RepID=UPI003241DFEE
MSLEETVEYIGEMVSEGELAEHYMDMALSLKRRGQIILYGPPGTGKTYTAKKFIELCSEKDSTKPRLWLYSTKLHMEGAVNWYVKRGLCTTIAEDDFILTVHVSDTQNSIIGLAKVKYSKGEKYKNEEGEELYKNHFEDIYYFKPSLTTSLLNKHYQGAEDEINEVCATVNSQNNADRKLVSNNLKEAIIACLNEISERDKIIEIIKNIDNEIVPLQMCTFHPSFSYEDFIEGYKPIQTNEGLVAFRLEDGIFKEYCKQAEKNPDTDYYFIIDEINRGNTAKVFGEIITLLELDKRNTTLTLPQSKTRFAIPSNLYIIGTMNSADRSISSLDVALRRRFALIEIPSEPECLHNTISYEKNGEDCKQELSSLLEEINSRLKTEMGISSNKYIGHGYFYQDGQEIEEPLELRDILKFEILPILMEYCSYETNRYTEVFGYLEELCFDLSEE